jgi:UDP-N-acetylmuramate--alanine ligase
MSALAEFLHQKGCLITGSDRQASELTGNLTDLGIPVRIGHSAEGVGDVDGVIYTAAASADNPELEAARRRGIPLLRRAELLGQLTQGHRVVGVTGTHGKTTTTAMVGAVLEAAGLDPTVLVGGVVRGPEHNLRVGEGAFWAVEADEFDRSFLELTPSVAVVTSLEADHLDCYEDLEAICRAFEQFLESVPEGGHAVLWGDAARVRDLAVKRGVERILYGLESDARIRATQMAQEGFTSRFEVFDGGRRLGEIRLQAPGAHNVSNALAAVGVGTALGLSWESLKVGLEAFQGVRRRFEILGEVEGVRVVSDYAHHPTEIRATLAAARQGWEGRIVAVFQPHLYSRTRDLAAGFGEALSGADRVWVTDVYAAREDPIPGVDGALIADYVRDAGGPEPRYVPNAADLSSGLAAEVAGEDLVVVMGAGDVERVAHDLLSQLKARADLGIRNAE